MAGKEPSPCDPARLPHIEVYTYDGVVKFIHNTKTDRWLWVCRECGNTAWYEIGGIQDLSSGMNLCCQKAWSGPRGWDGG